MHLVSSISSNGKKMLTLYCKPRLRRISRSHENWNSKSLSWPIISHSQDNYLCAYLVVHKVFRKRNTMFIFITKVIWSALPYVVDAFRKCNVRATVVLKIRLPCIARVQVFLLFSENHNPSSTNELCSFDRGFVRTASFCPSLHIVYRTWIFENMAGLLDTNYTKRRILQWSFIQTGYLVDINVYTDKFLACAVLEVMFCMICCGHCERIQR